MRSLDSASFFGSFFGSHSGSFFGVLRARTKARDRARRSQPGASRFHRFHPRRLATGCAIRSRAAPSTPWDGFEARAGGPTRRARAGTARPRRCVEPPAPWSIGSTTRLKKPARPGGFP